MTPQPRRVPAALQAKAWMPPTMWLRSVLSRRMVVAGALLLSTVLASTASPAQPPEGHHAKPLSPFRATYAVHLGGEHRGESTLTLERIPDGWRYTVEAEGTRGLARLSGFEASHASDFALVDGHPRLHRAVSRTSALLRTRRSTLHFDWKRRQARWSGDVDSDRRGPLPLKDDAVNAPLLNLALALDLRGKAAGDVLHYHLVDRGRADPTTYTVGAPERIEVPFGRWHAIPLRNERQDKARVTTVWFAPGLPPTPLRVLQVEDGEAKYELRLLRLE